jgi:hypothetical protein
MFTFILWCDAGYSILIGDIPRCFLNIHRMSDLRLICALGVQLSDSQFNSASLCVAAYKIGICDAYIPGICRSNYGVGILECSINERDI